MTAATDAATVLREAGVAATAGSADVGPAPADVSPADWAAATASLHAAGYVWFDHLTAVDEPHDDRIAVVLVVATADLGARAAVRTGVPRAGGSLPTAGTHWAGALWAEREAHEMLGVGFDGHPGLRPLLLPPGTPPPLRRDVLLEARQSTTWPGHQDPADRGPDGAQARGGRRRSLPPGVDPDRAAP
jgi:NADH:ubiquinone oxidoreductase subunit C